MSLRLGVFFDHKNLLFPVFGPIIIDVSLALTASISSGGLLTFRLVFGPVDNPDVDLLRSIDSKDERLHSSEGQPADLPRSKSTSTRGRPCFRSPGGSFPRLRLKSVVARTLVTAESRRSSKATPA